MKRELAERSAEQVLARRAFERALVRQDRALDIAATFVLELAAVMRLRPSEVIDEIAWRVGNVPTLTTED